ncbi:MAG: hypothetical protein RIE86_09420 [Imperialibacter sp.]|uniref:hypothetical protein n=1 Tax=Imperialibacter sp. TaxID=2038411 RepID=UPI0032EF27F1
MRFIDPDGRGPYQYRTLEDANNGTVTGATETIGGKEGGQQTGGQQGPSQVEPPPPSPPPSPFGVDPLEGVSTGQGEVEYTSESSQGPDNDYSKMSKGQKISALLNGIRANNKEKKDSYLTTMDRIFKNYPKTNYGQKEAVANGIKFSEEMSTEVYVEFLHNKDYQTFDSMHPDAPEQFIGADNKSYTRFYFRDSDFTTSKHSRITLMIRVPTKYADELSKFLLTR